MPSTDLAHFLNVALDVQKVYYAGIRVSDSVMAATDNVMLVAKKYDEGFLRGEGTISPQAARVLAALAEVAFVNGIDVDGNRAAVRVLVGGESGEYQTVTLPEFYCKYVPVERLVGKLTDAGLGWEHLVENPRLKTLKDAGAEDYVALVESLRAGSELFRLRTDDDPLYYSVAQLRRGLRLFGARARLRVRRSRVGWLAFEDGFGQIFVVTPFQRDDGDDDGDTEDE